MNSGVPVARCSTASRKGRSTAQGGAGSASDLLCTVAAAAATASPPLFVDLQPSGVEDLAQVRSLGLTAQHGP